MYKIGKTLPIVIVILALLIMPSEYKKKSINLTARGESILSLVADKADKLRFTVSSGAQFFRDGAKPALKMETIGNTSKSTINLYGDNVTHESKHHYAIINQYIFMFGLDNTTGFPAVYRSSNGTAWTKIKDWGVGDETSAMWARNTTLTVVFYDGVSLKYSYSNDYGATWSAAAAWTPSYIYNHWTFNDGVYLDNGSKIMVTTDGYTTTDFWNYSTIEPIDMVEFGGFIYVVGVKDAGRTVSFGRLENGRYKEIKSWYITNNDFQNFAIGRTEDYIIISFPQKRRLQIYAFDLDNLYHIGDISGTYTGVRSSGRDQEGNFYIMANTSTTNSGRENVQIQITNELGIFKNRTWNANYVVEDLIIYLNNEYWVIMDDTANKLYLCPDDEGGASSLSASVTITTDFLDIGEHIPIGIRVHHDGGMGESGLRQNMIINTYLDMWGDALGISLGECNCANENRAAAAKIPNSLVYSEFDAAQAMMATNFRFANAKTSRGDRVWFSIQMLADTEDITESPVLYGIDYIYKPVDFGNV